MLQKRSLSAVVLIVILLAAIFWLPRPLVALLVGFIIGTGLWEFYTVTEAKGLRPFKPYGIVSGVVLAVVSYLYAAYRGLPEIDEIILVMLFLITAILLVKHAFKKDDNSVIANSATAILGIIYVSFLFTFIIKLRYLPDASAGKGWVVALFCVTKFSDISAYIVGSRWGKHKLIPRISAKKSIEGALAGVFGAVCLSLIFRVYFLQGLGWLATIGLGVLLGVVGQTGDLIESLMKRDAGVKDSGRVLPGIGGVLDLMDSLLLAAPAMYLYLKLFL